MAYSSGKNAYGICDISGFRYKLKDMKRTWNGLLVGPDMFDSKHPQLEPRTNKVDPQAVREPRPDISVSPTIFTVYTNFDLGIIGTKITTPDSMTSALGTVTITTS